MAEWNTTIHTTSTLLLQPVLVSIGVDLIEIEHAHHGLAIRCSPALVLLESGRFTHEALYSVSRRSPGSKFNQNPLIVVRHDLVEVGKLGVKVAQNLACHGRAGISAVVLYQATQF